MGQVLASVNTIKTNIAETRAIRAAENAANNARAAQGTGNTSPNTGAAQGTGNTSQNTGTGRLQLDLEFFGDKSGGGRSKNDLKPDPKATGDHSTFKVEPNTNAVTNYETWRVNPQNPRGFDTVIRYDGIGKPHFNNAIGGYVDTPHVHDRLTPGDVRPPNLWEIPWR